jgi:hypothetical protein
MPTKHTVYFLDKQSGWTETYYLVGESLQGSGTQADALVDQRVKVLGNGAELIGDRISITSIPRQSRFHRYARPGEASDPGVSIIGQRFADQASAAVIMPYRTAGGARRNVTLSGFPDAWLDRPTEFHTFFINAAGKTKLDIFYAWLLNPGGLSIQERLRTLDFAPKEILTISFDPNGRYRITHNSGLQLKQGQKVAITKLEGTNVACLRGTHKIATVQSPTEFSVDAGGRTNLPDPVYEGGAFFSLVAYTFTTAQGTVENYMVTTRKRGRPLPLRHGRRSAKC